MTLLHIKNREIFLYRICISSFDLTKRVVFFLCHRKTDSRQSSITNIPLPNKTPERKPDDREKLDPAEKSSPSSLSLVPYGCDASSESDGEFTPPKTSPSKEPTKSSKSFFFLFLYFNFQL